MTASAHVVQLVRAHYGRDESAFSSAVGSLARASKVPAVKAALMNLMSKGYGSSGASSYGQSWRPAHHQPAPAPPPNAEAKVGGMLERLAPMSFDELLLPGELQAFLDELVVELEYRDELAERKLRARNRFLFYGPPGNGKTSAASALAKSLGVPAFGVSLPRTVSKYIGATGENVGKIFDALTPNTLVVFDELDAVAAHRGVVDHSAGKEFNSIVNTLLTLMDRHRHGIIVATTNRPDIIDPALMRRFDEHIMFPAPSAEQMRSLAARLCAKYEVEPIDVSNCENFDAVTKCVEREARRMVMRELLAVEEDNESEEVQEEQES